MRTAETGEEIDLSHYGDREVGHGRIDLAVTVRRAQPPTWLTEHLAAALLNLAPYPTRPLPPRPSPPGMDATWPRCR